MQKLFQNEDRNFLIFFIAAIFLYLQNAWLPGFFQDGYLYAALGKNAAERGYWLIPHVSETFYSEFVHHTPFVFILEGIFFKIFGATYSTARIFGAIFVLITLFILYLNLKKEFDLKTVLLCIICFVVLPPLIKKTRFPNLDLPLLLFTLSSFIYYKNYFVDKAHQKNLVFAGVFLGLAMLTKGPMAFFVPIGLVIYLVLSKNTKKIIDLKLWMSFILATLIFALWPLALYLHGRFDIFLSYFNFTFIETMKDARGAPSPFYTYFIFLLKQVGPWFLLALYSIKLNLKEKNSFILFSQVVFFSSLLLLSIAKFKYSHYLIFLYPYMAICSGWALSKLISDKAKENVVKVFQGLLVVVIVTISIFPLTNKIKRDPEIHKILSYISPNKPVNWYVSEGVYPYYSLVSLVAWDHYGNIKYYNNDMTAESGKRVYLLNDRDFISFKNKNVDWKHSFKKIYQFKKYKMTVLVERDLVTSK